MSQRRPADSVHLIGVDALSDVATDRESGEMDVRAATVFGPPAVEPDPGVDRAVLGRLVELDL